MKGRTMGFDMSRRVAAVLLAATLGTGLSLRAQDNPAPPPATAPASGARGASPAGGARGTGGRLALPLGGGRGLSGGFSSGFGSGGRGGTPGAGFDGVTGAPSSPPAAGAPLIATDGPSTTLDGTIYSVRLPLNQIGRMDIDALTKAADTPADFEKALAALGTVRPLYHVDQSIRLKGDEVIVGASVPYITNSQMTQNGKTINSVSYTQVGARFVVTGSVAPAGGMDVDLSIRVSVKADGDTAISDTVKAPNFQTATMSHKGPVQPRVPFVVMSVDAGSSGSSGMGSACIARVIFGPPE